ncbi:hypothetical protein GCM10011380_08910 [Sphingomonas metalli]|uniref:DUF4376 domain-containing protein n=1 Tax=Sphingomonas metalli TaxID=1779358 RepID=A0A916SWZ2_9SPHN|nr:hypothetical protein [Sphingomonas metalli]GGB21546.1 hypothetical protein GCM10011380_08910 [Sphingomonas metalli]
MEYWIVYDLVTGAELYAGSGMPGTAAYQHPPEGAGIVVVPQAVIAQQPRDLDALRAALVMGVDNEAERVRSRYVTALPAQIGTYVLKEAAARAWLANSSASTAMLLPEAAARGMTIADLAAEVIANADAWTQLSGAIEGVRFAAKARIAAAPTIGAIVQAALLDWSVLDAPAG